MKPTLTEQLAHCDEWMEANKPVEWPSMEVKLLADGDMSLGFVASWTRGERKVLDGAWVYEKAIRPGHWSVLEFSWFCYAVTGISRICTHELVRHRQMSYMQESTRAVPNPGVIVVPSFDLPVDEAARYETLGQRSSSILVAGNSRAWAELLRKRLCKRAAPEIRWLAYCIATDLREISPLVYACAVPDCNKCEERDCG
jgi:thymidylate synthase (FAD)